MNQFFYVIPAYRVQVLCVVYEWVLLYEQINKKNSYVNWVEIIVYTDYDRINSIIKFNFYEYSHFFYV